MTGQKQEQGCCQVHGCKMLDIKQLVCFLLCLLQGNLLFLNSLLYIAMQTLGELHSNARLSRFGISSDTVMLHFSR